MRHMRTNTIELYLHSELMGLFCVQFGIKANYYILVLHIILYIKMVFLMVYVLIEFWTYMDIQGQYSYKKSWCSTNKRKSLKSFLDELFL